MIFLHCVGRRFGRSLLWLIENIGVKLEKWFVRQRAPWAPVISTGEPDISDFRMWKCETWDEAAAETNRPKWSWWAFLQWIWWYRGIRKIPLLADSSGLHDLLNLQVPIVWLRPVNFLVSLFLGVFEWGADSTATGDWSVPVTNSIHRDSFLWAILNQITIFRGQSHGI